MKRDEIKAIFPDATDEQLDQIMSINGADINNAKSGMDELRQQLQTAQSALEAEKSKPSISAEDLQKEKERVTALETELNGLKQSNQIRDMRLNVAKEKNIPAELLTGETEEACKTQADAILAFAKPAGYPAVPDGGEARPASTSARDQFAAWAENQFS